MKNYPIRMLNALAFLLCCALLGTALFIQLDLQLEPCPLCEVQRMVLILIAVIFLLAALHHPGATGARIYGVLIFITAAVGAVFSGRQVYLQMLPPDQAPSCGAGLEYMIAHLPFKDLVQQLFQGTGECAKISLDILGLSIPSWMLIFFILFAGVGCFQLFSRYNP